MHGSAIGQSELLEEIEAMAELGFNVKGMCAINKQWISRHKQGGKETEEVDGPHQTLYSSAKAEHDVRY